MNLTKKELILMVSSLLNSDDELTRQTAEATLREYLAQLAEENDRTLPNGHLTCVLHEQDNQ